MVDFGAIIGGSAEWTKQVLFKPFNFKKWMVLAFIAIMAGAMSHGCNLNSGGNGSHYEQKQEQQESAERKPGSSAQSCAPSAEETGIIIAVVAVIAVIIIAVALVLMWLCSRFSFVFLEDVIKNDASIKAPFGANADAGNSFFRFNLVFTAAFLAILGFLAYLVVAALVRSGLINVSDPTPKQVLEIIMMLLPALIIGSILFIITGIVALITVDLVIPIMYKERIRVLAAWGKAWALVKRNAGNLIVYILIKMGLGIAAGIAYILAFIAGFIIVAIPVALVVLVLWFIQKTVPGIAILPYWIFFGVVLTPVCLFLLYCLMALNLPFAVFFRTYSLKFLEKLDPRYALIKTEKPVAPQQ
ncbi:MAG: hypothetical protein PHO67_02885 [Candidatus Omnitrophica bacterium]|nr:hypothetical protein [Candidatus Omnitrophota bacterium]